MPAKKPAVGAVPLGPDHDVIATIKTNLDMLTGRTTGELKPLASTAALTDCINAINAIIARLNASTN